ncbi:heavy metal translocating P-type ATPase [Sulfobacillus acidophilus TPY]|uniref:P-type Cu(+) transporter n=1 Tax=Sulfobacillus acidophilus (strain ATCC 700253 / DSM 10332 / NAL) TaxID=679936 RepID=G8TT98_SULAD|nr:heavy metal translocating P-type ATPase [Sulfobacillus acidophilus TPY]AEW04478.1 heavy metal translocating P-type ATPase [Sulfobacillus acidophilus DSM 10332]
MAVLTCDFCDQPIVTPVPADGHTFCCHACRELWRIIGEDELKDLKSRPGVDWEELKQQISRTTPTPAISFGSAQPESLALDIEGMWCASCALLIEQVLARSPGVLGVQIDYATSTASVAIDRSQVDAEAIRTSVRKLGYGVKEHGSTQPEDGKERDLLTRFGVSLVLSMFVMMFSVPVWSGYLPALPPVFHTVLGYGLMLLATPVVFWGGWPFLRGAWASIRHLYPTMDLLIAIGTLSAYGYSWVTLLTGGKYLYFDTAAMLVTFLLLSRVLESATKTRAGSIVRLLSRMMVRQVRRLDADGQIRLVPIEQVAAGDKIVVLPGERIGADGVVVEGRSTIDESILTGESLPVEKGPDDRVYTGTMNHTGRLVVLVDRAGDESLVAQIARYVRQANEARGPWQTLAERILRIFVPVVLGFGVLTLVLTHWAIGEAWPAALLRMVAVFVIACPCALSVATPLAIMAGVQRLAQWGILVRSADGLERLAAIDTIVLDKTGTLTEGQMTVESVWPNADTVLPWAASVEVGSEHPIAQAIVRAAEARHLPLYPGEAFVTTPGFGVTARIGSHRVSVDAGHDRPLPPPLEPIVAEWRASGGTVSIVTRDDTVMGAILLRDPVRADAVTTIHQLKAAGYRLAMLSGDHPLAAQRLADTLGISHWQAQVKPLEKADWIRQEQAAGHRVAFVGDGINDSPALVTADLGIAMGQGADLAIESGQLTLTRPQLEPLVTAFHTGRQAVRIIRQNLGWAFLYNVLALPAAALGWTSPLIAAAAMVLSSTFVLGNSLRILGWSPKRYAWGAALVGAVTAVLFALAWWGV